MDNTHISPEVVSGLAAKKQAGRDGYCIYKTLSVSPLSVFWRNELSSKTVFDINGDGITVSRRKAMMSQIVTSYADRRHGDKSCRRRGVFALVERVAEEVADLLLSEFILRGFASN